MTRTMVPVPEQCDPLTRDSPQVTGSTEQLMFWKIFAFPHETTHSGEHQGKLLTVHFQPQISLISEANTTANSPDEKYYRVVVFTYEN